MKSFTLIGMISLIMVLLLSGCAQPAVQGDEGADVVEEQVKESAGMSVSIPSVTIEPGIVMLDGDQQVVISGAGFPPDSEVVVRAVTGIRDLLEERVNYEITPQLDYPVTDQYGAFTATMVLDRMTRLLEPGVYPAWVIVGDVTVNVPLVYAEEAEEEE